MIHLIISLNTLNINLNSFFTFDIVGCTMKSYFYFPMENPKTQLFVNANAYETRVCRMDGDELSGFDCERRNVANMDCIYIVTVQRIEQSLNAIFVDYGGGDKQGFLQISDLNPSYCDLSNECDHRSRINKVISSIPRGTMLIAQVIKEPRGNKGPSFSTYIHLFGEYLVLSVDANDGICISDKINDNKETHRLESIIRECAYDKNHGIIVRTAASGILKKDIDSDLEYLCELWTKIQVIASKMKCPSILHESDRMVKNHILDLPNTSEIVIDNYEEYKKVKDFVKRFRQDLQVRLYRGKTGMFSHYRIEKNIDSLFSSRVDLKSGGYLILDTTEALHIIDVNSGSIADSKNVHETAEKTNKEAVLEIVRHVILRNIGGLIAIDLIDMENPKSRYEIEKLLQESFKRDKAKHTIGSINEFGIVIISRQRLKRGIMESCAILCPRCSGSGYIRSPETAFAGIITSIENELLSGGPGILIVYMHDDVISYILNHGKAILVDIESRFGSSIRIEKDASYETSQFRVIRDKNIIPSDRRIQITSTNVSHIMQSNEHKNVNNDSWIQTWINYVIRSFKKK